MTPDEARTIAKAAAKETVRETFQLLGIDPDDPTEAQRDFQFVRSWRTSSEAVKRQSLVMSVSVIVAGVLGLIWLAIKGGP